MTRFIGALIVCLAAGVAVPSEAARTLYLHNSLPEALHVQWKPKVNAEWRSVSIAPGVKVEFVDAIPSGRRVFLRARVGSSKHFFAFRGDQVHLWDYDQDVWFYDDGWNEVDVVFTPEGARRNGDFVSIVAPPAGGWPPRKPREPEPYAGGGYQCGFGRWCLEP